MSFSCIKKRRNKDVYLNLKKVSTIISVWDLLNIYFFTFVILIDGIV